MKSTVFYLKYPEESPDRMTEMNMPFTIPTLPAYAIEYSEFSASDQMGSGQKVFVEDKDFEIEGDKLIWKNYEEPLLKASTVYRLTVHYHGIRDYSMLFPHVLDKDLRERLGTFYEEAEIAFENGAWLSFALMCGAIYEGLLYSLYSKNMNFNKMIQKALLEHLIDNETAAVMDSTRNLRNIVHGNRFSEPYVTRLQAMDMRKVMDKLIKQAWK